MALPHISYSRLHLLACPYASFLKYSGNVKGPTTKWIARGNAVHHALEHSFNEAGFSLEEAIRLYREEFARIVDEEYVSVDWPTTKKLEAEAIIMLEKVNDKIESGIISAFPLAMEKEFEIPFGGTKVVGKIDRLDYDPDTDEYSVTDYKTGKDKPEKWFLRHNPQLTAYAWAVLEMYGKLPSKVIWHHLATDELLETERTIQDIDDVKQTVTNAIAMDENGIRHRIFHEKVCGQCDFAGEDLCTNRELEAQIEEALGEGKRMVPQIYVKPRRWSTG